MRAPFWPFPEPAVVSAEPFLRFSEDFCLFTTSWLDELKLSEAWRFIAGMFIFGTCTLDRDVSEAESATPNDSRVYAVLAPDGAVWTIFGRGLKKGHFNFRPSERVNLDSMVPLPFHQSISTSRGTIHARAMLNCTI